MSTQNTAGDPASEGAGGVAFENLPDRPTIRKAVAASAMGNATEWYAVSYTHLTLPTIHVECRSRWSPYH